MKTVLITRDAAVSAAAREGLGAEAVRIHPEWTDALADAQGADLIVVDLLATLEEPGRIAGYEKFAYAKMDHPVAANVPLVLLSPPPEVELDFMTGWPDFLFAQVRLPVTADVFRRFARWLAP